MFVYGVTNKIFASYESRCIVFTLYVFFVFKRGEIFCHAVNVIADQQALPSLCIKAAK
jgi:hypothetical protein